MKYHYVLEKANSSKDKQSFLEFLKALRNDFLENRETWENITIDDYLESIERWIENYHNDDIDFEKPDWKTISAMFYMGKLYE